MYSKGCVERTEKKIYIKKRKNIHHFQQVLGKTNAFQLILKA